MTSTRRVPGGNDSYPTNAIVITGTYDFNNVPAISGLTLAHEIGHAFGLIHTFGNGSCKELVTRDPLNGGNCSDCGDKVCDTPADPSADLGQPTINYMDLVDINCNYKISNFYRDAQNQPYAPDTKNLMSYYHECLESLTEGQGARMRGIANAFANYMPHVANHSPLRITSDVTFTGTVKLKQPILVKSGATLTIEGRLEMSKDSSIIVEPGGVLKIDGGIITRYIRNFVDTCPLVEGMWGGIKVLGASNLPQNALNQGKVLIYNGGIIEYATTAISLVATVNGHPYGGGIISANNAIFRNNGLAVSMGSYEYAPNISSFTNCTFEINNDYYTTGVIPSGFVNIWRNKDVKFRGCDFINDAWEQSFAQNLYGIQSYDAAFSVDFHCDGSNTYPCATSFHDSSTFENLRYGIKANKISSAYTYSVANSKFVQNYRGIYNSGVDQPAILRNNFSFGINQYPDHMVGISIISGTGYRVEENVFLGKASANSETVGIWVDGTGAADNEVYKNTFYNIGYAQ